MIVDAHLHVWQAVANYPDPTVTTVSPVCDVPLELLCEYMDEHGVDRAVLVQPLYPGEDNRYVADCAAADPQRFAAVCVVDPRNRESPAQLNYWVTQRGCRGLRLRPRVPAEAGCFGQPSTFPLWDQARKLKVVVNVLAGPEHLPALTQLVQRYPEVAVLVDHMAHPLVGDGVRSTTFRALLGLAKYPRVYVKVSGFYYFSQQGYPYLDCEDLVGALYDHFGPQRLVWGSDFPHVLLKSGYVRSIKLLERTYAFLSPADLRSIMGSNASQLYWGQQRV